jgi:hypothetical protein
MPTDSNLTLPQMNSGCHGYLPRYLNISLSQMLVCMSILSSQIEQNLNVMLRHIFCRRIHRTGIVSLWLGIVCKEINVALLLLSDIPL